MTTRAVTIAPAGGHAIGLRAGLIRLQEPTDAQTAIALAAYYAALANKLLTEGRP